MIKRMMIVLGLVLGLTLVVGSMQAQAAPMADPSPRATADGFDAPTEKQIEDARAAGLTCTWHWSTDYGTVSQGNRSFEMGQDVHYRNCKGNGMGRFVDPITWTFACKNDNGPLVGVQDYQFNTRFYERGGSRGFDPASVTMECPRGNSWHEVEVNSPGVNQLRMCATGAPRWATTGKVRLTGATDKDFVLGGSMWGYIGPTPINC